MSNKNTKKAEDFIKNADYIEVSVLVHKDGTDCTAGGISSRANKVFLFKEDLEKEEILRYMREIEKQPESLAFIVDTLKYGIHTYTRAIQIIHCSDIVMAGGNFAYSSDSRYKDITGISYPISLHDRVEL